MIDFNELKESGDIKEGDVVMVKQKGRPLPVDGTIKTMAKTFMTVTPLQDGENADEMARVLDRMVENATLDDIVVVKGTLEYIMKLTINKSTDSETEDKSKEIT